MKHLTLTLALILSSAIAQAETYHTSQPGNAITKAQALREALSNPSTVIYKCNAVMVTEKATFKNIPNSGANNFISAPKTK
jgi:uncharacterized membrane protein